MQHDTSITWDAAARVLRWFHGGSAPKTGIDDDLRLARRQALSAPDYIWILVGLASRPLPCYCEAWCECEVTLQALTEREESFVDRLRLGRELVGVRRTEDEILARLDALFQFENDERPS